MQKQNKLKFLKQALFLYLLVITNVIKGGLRNKMLESLNTPISGSIGGKGETPSGNPPSFQKTWGHDAKGKKEGCCTRWSFKTDDFWLMTEDLAHAGASTNPYIVLGVCILVEWIQTGPNEQSKWI